MRTDRIVRKRMGGADLAFYEGAAGLYGADDALIERYWPVKPGQICFDIGAGPGSWTLAALARGAFTFSFDPRDLALTLLGDHIRLNGFSRAALVPAGLWDSTGTRPFTPTTATFKGPEAPMVERAPVITLDEYCEGVGLRRLDYLTMDVEGAECEAIRGGRATIRKYVPDLFIEVHELSYRDVLMADLRTLANYRFEDLGPYLIATSR